MTEQRWSSIPTGVREDLMNAAHVRADTGLRVCLHSDRTLHWSDTGMRWESCDYCEAQLVTAPGAVPSVMAAWLYPADESVLTRAS